MSIEFTNITKKNIFIEFILKNVSIPLANGIRRILLNDIPIVCFHKNITINKNISSLHNEFLEHRINFIPLFNKEFKIKSYYDFDNSKRIYEFIENPKEFNLIVKNTDKDKFITVTSDYFKIDNNKASDYILPDPYFTDSNEYDLIIYLKNNEEIDLKCIPNIGFAKNNSCYDPTGTLKYSFVKETPDVINKKLHEYIKYIQKEREIKELEPYTTNEINDIKKDFLILDSDRLYINNQYNFKIESVGNLYSYELLYNSIVIFQLKLIDLITNIKLNNDILIFSNNITFIDKNDYIELIVNNEDHTLGNIINQYINDYFNTFIEYSSYKIVHPLKNNIIFKIKLKENLKPIDNKLFYTDNDYNIKKVSYVDYYIYVFEYSIINIIKDLDNLRKQVSNQFNISKTNFDIDKYDNINNFLIL